MHRNVIYFPIRGHLTGILELFRAQESALTRNVSSPHGSKNLLQRGILYRHEKILLRQERSQARTRKNYVGKSNGFRLHLGIDKFVWARVLCGTRICCCAAVGCSGSTQKIHMRKIRVSQGDGRAWKYDGFHDPGTFDEDFGTLQSPWVRADAQCLKLTWLEELQRVILYRHERILLGREDCRPGPKKTICEHLVVFQ